jgi:hypothetical protein
VGTAKSPPEEGSGGLSLSVVWVGLFLPDVYFVVNALHVVDKPSLVCYATLASFLTINHVHLHVSIMPCKGRNNNISYPQICPQVYPQVHEESPGRPQPRNHTALPEPITVAESKWESKSKRKKTTTGLCTEKIKKKNPQR